jgi:hypothetical protein
MLAADNYYKDGCKRDNPIAKEVALLAGYWRINQQRRIISRYNPEARDFAAAVNA